MKEGYLHALVWSNVMASSVYQGAAASAPEIVHAWPTRSFGGQEVLSYRLTDEFALLLIKPNGGQVPTVTNQLPIPLLQPGCPIATPLDVFAVLDWAREAFKLSARDSTYVVPMVEAPTSPAEFADLAPEVQQALNAQIAHEFERLTAVLRRYASIAAPPRTLLHAGTVHVHGDVVSGDKIVNVVAPAQDISPRRLSVDDIDSFAKVRAIPPDAVRPRLDNRGYLNISEDTVQRALEAILAVPIHKKDWGGETNDLYTGNLMVQGRRLAAAFLLKGNGLRKPKMEIADCGKNGDQLVRLVGSPAELFVVQFVGNISESVALDISGKVGCLRADGRSVWFCLIDGQDTARLLTAYGQLPT